MSSFRSRRDSTHESYGFGQKAVAAAVGLAVCIGVFASWETEPAPEMLQAGMELFAHEWQPGDPLSGEGDGLGPVFNAKSCAECHFQGGVGGSGPNDKNVLVFEALPKNAGDDVRSGVIHAAAVSLDLKESTQDVREMFCVIPHGKTIRGVCFEQVVDLDPVSFERVNTPALWGLGLIDELSTGSISRSRYGRVIDAVAKELELDFSRTTPGRLRTLPDGRVGKFGWKGQFATLEEFVAAACAVEMGLTNPLRAQNKPGTFTEDESAKLDMSQEQFDALLAFVAELPPPRQVLPTDSTARAAALHGEQVFESVGCADCHVPDLGGVEGVYSDFCLHRVASRNNGGYGEELKVPPPEEHPLPDEWKTPPLWGVADTAPYWHDGSAATLEDAISRHDGAARSVRERFDRLSPEHRKDLLAFLKTLKAPELSTTLATR